MVAHNDYHLTQTNQQFQQLLGYTAEELAHLTVEQITHPDDWTEEAPIIQAILQRSRNSFQREKRYLKKDGSTLWVSLTSTVLFDEQNQPIYGLGMVQDITERRRAEQAIRDSEERLRLALDAANMGAWDVNLQTGEQIWSQQSQRLFGYEPGGFGGTPAEFFDRVHPQDRHPVHQAIEQAKQTGDYQIEYQLALPDQQPRWIAAQGKVWFDETGRPLRMSGVDLDITQQKQAEEALRRSEQLFRNLFDHAPIAISLVNPQTFRLERVNAALCRMLGYSAAELLTRSIADITHPDDLDADLFQMQRMLAGEIPGFSMEKRFFRQDGEVLWAYLTVTLLRGPDDRPLYCMGMMEDITDRKRISEALRQSQQRFQRIVDNVPGMIYQYVLYPDGSDALLYVSPRSRDIYELAPEVVQQDPRAIWSLIYPEDFPRMAALIQASARTGVPFDLEYRITLPSGTIKWLHAIARPTTGNTGETIWDGLVLDISDRKRNEAERKYAEQKLRDSLHEKEVLLKEIHHRVKNNLQMVSSFLSLQAATINDPAILQPFTESQQRIRVMALIHERLYQSDDLARVNMAIYLHDLVQDLFRSCIAHHSPIQWHLEVEEIELGVDVAIPCGLILNELVSNAIKYAFPAGRTGTVQIGFGQTADPVSGLDKLTQYFLVVRDNGVGLSDTVDLQSTGTLGLQLVSLLTQKLQGTLRIHRQEGTEFELLF